MTDNTPICIIGGYDQLSKSFFNTTKKTRCDSIFINLSNKFINKKDVFNYKVFQLKKILNTIKKSNISQILFLGKIDRPNLSEFESDGEIEKYIPSLIKSYKKGDGSVLTTVVDIFKEKGFHILSPFKISNEYFFSKDELNNVINKKDLIDINKSVKILNDLSKYDNAQSIISVNGYIIAIEAAEGTDSALRRSFLIKKKLNQLNIKSGILTKIPKSKQSKIVDLPVIGPKTIFLVKEANLSGIAIKRKFTMIENKAKTIYLVKKYKLNLYNIS